VPPRTRKAAPKKAAAKKPSTLERLRAQADTGFTPEPYPIDDVTPPILIQAPDSAEQQLAFNEFFNSDGTFMIADARRILETACGDQFPKVWELVRHEKLPVLLALINDMGRHFDEQNALELVSEDDVPGGTAASST
jgi:hypothetical protein